MCHFCLVTHQIVTFWPFGKNMSEPNPHPNPLKSLNPQTGFDRTLICRYLFHITTSQRFIMRKYHRVIFCICLMASLFYPPGIGRYIRAISANIKTENKNYKIVYLFSQYVFKMYFHKALLKFHWLPTFESKMIRFLFLKTI